MKNIAIAGLLSLRALAACSGLKDGDDMWVDTRFGTGTDYHPDVFVPGQERRIDGSVWDDGAFNSPEAKKEFCEMYASEPWFEEDAWFCEPSD